MIITHFNIKKEKIICNHLTFQPPTTNPFTGHAHNAYELILVAHGKGSYTVNSDSFRLSKNSLILIKPSEYHFIDLNPHEVYERYNILFSQDFFPKALMKKFPSANHFIPNEVIIQNLKKMDHYSKILSEGEFLDVCECLLKEILYVLPSLSQQTNIGYNPILQKALNYIQENLWHIENIAEISNNVNISAPYLFQLFKNVLHISPHKYILYLRLLEAGRLIQKGTPTTQVAKDCGFKSYSAFYKQYKKIFGYNPTNPLSSSLFSINKVSPLD